VLTSWSRLYDMLHKAFPADRYVQGVTVEAVEQNEAQVVVRGQCQGELRAWQAELAIASDGIRSTVRQQLGPDVQPEYVGYVAWRGLCDESVLSNLTRQTVFEKFGFGLPPSEQLIGYPVAGEGNDTRVGHRAYNFVWYRPTTAQGLRLLLTDADGVHHPGGIAPHKVSWRHIAAMREAAQQLLAPQFAEMVQKTAMPFLQPIYDVYSDVVTKGRVALMGDAAFVARPHIGMGVAKAAQDAVAIADAIRTHGANQEALQAYAQQRLSAGRTAVRRAQWLGSFVKSTDGSTQPMTKREHHALFETAIDLERYGHQSAFQESTSPL